jgi:hypothetical protein
MASLLLDFFLNLNKVPKPVFPENCKSMAKEFLTDEMWELLKDVKDEHGYTLVQLVNSGVKNPDSNIGVYVGSADSYRAFAPFLDKIIFKYHGHDPSNDLH